MGAEGRFEREFVAGVEKSGVKKSGVGPPQSRSFANSRAGGVFGGKREFSRPEKVMR